MELYEDYGRKWSRKYLIYCVMFFEYGVFITVFIFLLLCLGKLFRRQLYGFQLLFGFKRMFQKVFLLFICVNSLKFLDIFDFQDFFEYRMVFFFKIFKKKKILNGCQDWQILDCYCDSRKEVAKGNGEKVDMLMVGLVFFLVGLFALVLGGFFGFGWFCRFLGYSRIN